MSVEEAALPAFDAAWEHRTSPIPLLRPGRAYIFDDGHAIITSLHAHSTRDAFGRLATQVMEATGSELPLQAINNLLAGAFDIVVQQERAKDGRRRVVTISEVQGIRHDEIILRDLFVFHTSVEADGTLGGSFTATGAMPQRLPLLELHSGPLEHLFESSYLQDALGQAILQNPEINEIMINGPCNIWIEERGHLHPAREIRFRDKQHLMNVVNTLIAPYDRRLDDLHPMVSVRLPDSKRFPGGGRVNAVLDLVSGMPIVTIRRHSQTRFTLERLVDLGSLTPGMAAFLRKCVRGRLNIIISGGTGSGKSTLLGAIATEINLQRERLIVIEDPAELAIGRPDDNIVILEARPEDRFGEGAVDFRDLVQNALRMRPSRIIIGELRGAETLDGLQGAQTGHPFLTTIHTNSPQELPYRLETLVLMAPEAAGLTLAAIRRQIATLNIIVQQERMEDGSRKVTSIAEIAGVDERDQVIVRDIFRFVHQGTTREGEVRGEHVVVGDASRTRALLQSRGMDLEV